HPSPRAVGARLASQLDADPLGGRLEVQGAPGWRRLKVEGAGRMTAERPGAIHETHSDEPNTGPTATSPRKHDPQPDDRQRNREDRQLEHMTPIARPRRRAALGISRGGPAGVSGDQSEHEHDKTKLYLKRGVSPAMLMAG